MIVYTPVNKTKDVWLLARAMLRKGEEQRILLGHPWVFDNEILSISGECADGGIIDVISAGGKFLGRGYFNPKSKITVRILTREDEEINRAFFEKRIVAAWEYRKRVADINCCRVIFSEADLLPALIVDKFGDYLSVQTLALGIDVHKEMLIDILDGLISPKGIFERNDVPVREKEGLAQQKGFLKGKFDTTVEIIENGNRMLVDIENGQKTGYFLDQRENRAAIAPYVAGADVLDAFCHTGGFAVHAARYGAKSVEAVDISEHAIDYARRNAALNGFEGVINGVVGNVFDILKEYDTSGRQFDTIILDPPAFCKSRAALNGAYRGYKEINLRAMKLLRAGGFLITCSCSHYMLPQLFTKMLTEAAADSKRIIRQIEFRAQSKDHPVLLGEAESLYLKCVILQVM